MVAANVAAWNRKLIPRVLRDVSKVSTETSILGQSIALPVLVAPSSYHILAHETAERGTTEVRVNSFVRIQELNHYFARAPSMLVRRWWSAPPQASRSRRYPSMPPSTSRRQDFPTRAAGSNSTVRRWFCLVMSAITQSHLNVVMRDRKWVAEFVKRAEVAGYSALCLTVDLPIQGLRQRDIFNKFLLPSNCQMVNFGKAPRDLAASTGVRYDQQAHNSI